MIQLAVWAGRDRVGTLEHDTSTNLFDFRYADQWLQLRDGFPLSPQMPRDESFVALAPVQRSAIVRAFFQNLLPEGQALEVAAQANGLSKGNLAGLLIALGAETAGALRVTVVDAADGAASVQHEASDASALRPLPIEELSERIRMRPQMPFAIWDGKVRLSIAGLQDKIAVFENKGQMFLANGGDFASTVILKPAPVDGRFADLPAVEHVCMQLAAAVGISTARTRLLHVPEPVLLVERFDRRRLEDGRVERLHIIDACQALGVTPELKYERAYGDQEEVKHLRDGVSLRQLFGIAELSPSPLAMRLQLLDRLVFNVLIGNTDAHGKNWSFFVAPRSGLLTLAPAYDLVDVEAVADEHMSTSFAMGIGDAFGPEELTPFEWASMAAQCGVAPRHLATRIKALGSMLPRLLSDAGNDLPAQGVSPELLSEMGARLQLRCSAVAEAADEIPRVPSHLL